MWSERRTQLYAEEQPEMKDSYGREIDYLRISVTDRCNLRCRYCMPEGIDKLPMPDLLTYEEIEETARAAARLGFRKLKVTGGEPLVRRNVPELIGILKRIPGIREVTVTTNGTLLAEQIGALKAAGLDAVNVSLDTLRPERFREITGTDALASVLEGIQASLDAGIRTTLNGGTAAAREGPRAGRPVYRDDADRRRAADRRGQQRGPHRADRPGVPADPRR